MNWLMIWLCLFFLPQTPRTLVLDRYEGDWAVFLDCDERAYDIPKQCLRPPLRPGQALRPVGIDWTVAPEVSRPTLSAPTPGGGSGQVENPCPATPTDGTVSSLAVGGLRAPHSSDAPLVTKPDCCR